MVWRCWRRGSGWRRISRVCAWFVGRVLWPVRVSGEAAHLPRKRGCSVEETRHCTTQAPPSAAPTAWTTGSATPTGPFRRWGSGCMPFPGDCIPEARNGRGIKETAFKPPREATSGLARCICSKSVTMARGWQGQVAVSQVRHAVSWRLLHITGKERQGHKRNGVQTA